MIKMFISLLLWIFFILAVTVFMTEHIITDGCIFSHVSQGESCKFQSEFENYCKAEGKLSLVMRFSNCECIDNNLKCGGEE